MSDALLNFIPPDDWLCVLPDSAGKYWLRAADGSAQLLPATGVCGRGDRLCVRSLDGLLVDCLPAGAEKRPLRHPRRTQRISESWLPSLLKSGFWAPAVSLTGVAAQPLLTWVSDQGLFASVIYLTNSLRARTRDPNGRELGSVSLVVSVAFRKELTPDRPGLQDGLHARHMPSVLKYRQGDHEGDRLRPSG